MWLRDSANQLQSYKPVLRNSSDIARLYRGAINLQGRYIRQHPYCNAFQPPPEANIALTKRSLTARQNGDTVTPPYDPNVVWECKYELDSLAAFFQLSWDYYEETKDAEFFGKFSWADTTKKIIEVVKGLMGGTFTEDGQVIKPPYTWQRQSTRSTETVANNGNGDPVKGGIGLIRSFFRPSDDSCIYQYLIPANMMFSRYIKASAEIMKTIDETVAAEMEDIAAGIVEGINKYAIVHREDVGDVYAYEIDGFGSHILMVCSSILPSMQLTTDTV